jgi:hypothetical protein
MITVDAADDDELVMTDGQKVILRDVAFDLAFFVADPGWRAEDPSYYGPERARSEIENALERLGSRSEARFRGPRCATRIAPPRQRSTVNEFMQ